MTNIYKEETLKEIFGDEEGTRAHKERVSEIVCQLAKGSGKNHMSTIAASRVVYLLLCLNNPAKYYGKPNGNSIDIINIAINAKQAYRTFFNPLKNLVEKSPWFQGKFHATKDTIEFDKNINCFSGHSEREGWEGYNVIMVILDEISGFSLESTSGQENSKTAEAIYKMYKGSVQSRYPKFGKTVLLSFPRFKSDFIQKRYSAVIKDKKTVIRTHKFKLHDDIPDGDEDNEFEIQWEEDHIESYREPRVLAVKRPTWDVNPTVDIEDLKEDFFRDPVDSLSRFACMPPEAIDAFFRDEEKIRIAFPSVEPPFYDNWQLKPWIKPDHSKNYYIHIDLAYKHDRAALAMAHCSKWVKVKYGNVYEQDEPFVVVDLLRYWEPAKDRNIDFHEIKRFVMDLKNMGFPLSLVTLDQWQSIEMMNSLSQVGVETDKLSVQKPQYEDLAMMVTEERIRGYENEILIDELLGLRIIQGNKVDHPRRGSNDLADAVCGAAYNVRMYEQQARNNVIEVQFPEEVIEPATNKDNNKTKNSPVPKAPPGTQAPKEIQTFLERMKVI